MIWKLKNLKLRAKKRIESYGEFVMFALLILIGTLVDIGFLIAFIGAVSWEAAKAWWKSWRS